MMTNPCKDCLNKGYGAYHDACEQYQAFKKKQALLKSEDAKTRIVANHPPYRVRYIVR